MRRLTILIILYSVLLMASSCLEDSSPQFMNSQAKQMEDSTLFNLLSIEQCGIDFSNTINEDYYTNIMNYDYLYNGGGVGIGDFNKDGLEDVFFTGNQVEDRLYFNRGNLEFEDVSSAVGINSNPGWSTGVSVVDINQDGWLDIYVCRSGPPSERSMHTNALYVNNGGHSFTEMAKSYGLAYEGNSTQASFFDMDKDGDLDMYLLTHPSSFGKRVSGAEIKALFDSGKLDQDHLYRNDEGKFVDVSKEAGIFDIAFGLGISIGDLNEDGWPDIYVSNDFDEGDELYINNHDGTFSKKINTMIRHTANYGMGCDLGDINNDGLPDIISLDMAFETHERAKRNMASMNVEKFFKRVELGWHYQYMTNMLHLNNGNGTFSEIAQVAGVHKTDWSWSALFADYDNDGMQDLFITNGYKRDTKDNDLDANVEMLQQEKNKESLSVEDVLGILPKSKIKNYMYQNTGALHFERSDDSWGLKEAVNSNGAAWADLDNDGDLELVLNNMDERAFIYQNHSAQVNENNFLLITVQNMDSTEALGAKVELRKDGKLLMREFYRERGFQSSVGGKLHFGLGGWDVVDSLIVYWPDGSNKLLEGVPANQLLTLKKNDGSDYRLVPKLIDPLFIAANEELKVSYQHKENPYNDFETEVLLPHKMSEFGPHISSGDLNNDGMLDFFIGGAAGFPAKIFFQMKDGTFMRTKHGDLEKDAGHEDLGSIIFDYDNDGDNDLYVVSGGNEFELYSGAYQDRLYENDGRGVLKRTTGVLPAIASSGMRAVCSDIDQDGDLDVVIGARVFPRNYPNPPKSIVLRNQGSSFEEATMELAPGFSSLGMVSDLKFDDIDGDGDEDLLVVGEWMSPQIFINDGGVFSEPKSMMNNKEGWWMSIAVADLDEDGDKDIVVGNIGMNNKFNPSPHKPLFVYSNDFDNNGSNDIVLAKYEKETLYPVRGKECSSEQMPFIADKFGTYKEFAISDLEDIYGAEKLNDALKLEAKEFRSGIFWNDGGDYSFEALPIEAQISPVNDILIRDFNDDGRIDILITGNMYGAEVETTRYDAGNGLLLFNDGERKFDAQTVIESGFNSPGNAKDMEFLEMSDGRKLILVANNNQSLQVFKMK